MWIDTTFAFSHLYIISSSRVWSEIDYQILLLIVMKNVEPLPGCIKSVQGQQFIFKYSTLLWKQKIVLLTL